MFAFAGGFSAVSFYDVVGRTVPMSWHARMWAQRLFYGGLLSALCALIVRQFLERAGFVARFGPLFALGTFFIALGAILFTFAEEPPVEVSRKELHLAAHLKESARVAWQDPRVPRALRHAGRARGRGDGDAVLRALRGAHARARRRPRWAGS